ncbi:60b05899-d293-4660-a2c3-5ace29e5ece9 [Sclerotinia trifoliorum]|uniref:60b05899-d293-4660-a2c3-5ace29e5ece9 n=1 Tax=Sclerotinia trifoliorum TaxID=28548 RepID=A0A8H2ZQU3_9HELO|nr:60b05899-d293-4660-a2c3-5ace29e5ece9 [Sclerotinia trifoliorum]
MHFSTPITLLAAFCTLATAMPAALAATETAPVITPTVTPHRITPNANEAIVNAYSGSSCDGTSTSFNIAGSGAHSCAPVTNVRSIAVSQNKCATYVWSGNNCEGSSTHISGNSCFSVLFASVSVQC